MSRLNPQSQNFGRLTGQQRKELTELLQDAFSLSGLDRMLVQQLNLRSREEWALGNDLQTIVYLVIDKAEQRSLTAELLAGARAERPSHVGLFQFAQQFDAAPSSVKAERVVRTHLGFLDPEVWMPAFMARLGQVCRVEVRNGGARGTGFLIGPDLVLTNYHVVADLIRGELAPSFVEMRFDLPAGMAGVLCPLAAENWLAAASGGESDAFAHATPDHLDFALLRLERMVGDEIIDASEGTRRGWIPLPPDKPPMQPGEPLLMLGYPAGGTLKLSLDTSALMEMNPQGARIRYRTNSEPGSSGSPCFSLDWRLLALHQAGDPATPPRFNQGIPISAIRAYLHSLLQDNNLPPWRKSVLSRLLDSSN
ncbi:MAG: trypsin-like peptidase domain-containing protein [Caldilineaceae bacterium]|nr:trypsin-like peptidase domain-containing protein [Caldilineaceae bacterium]